MAIEYQQARWLWSCIPLATLRRNVSLVVVIEKPAEESLAGWEAAAALAAQPSQLKAFASSLSEGYRVAAYESCSSRIANSCCNTEDEVLLKTLKMLRQELPEKAVKTEEVEEDLICDAVQENGEVSKDQNEGSNACLQGCISSCFGAWQDLRKVKVSEMVQQKVANSIMSAAASENNEPVLETVIEREDSIQKSALDTYSYR